MISWIISILFVLFPDAKTDLRNSFYEASKSRKAHSEFKSLLNTLPEDPLITGYKGMSEMLAAYHSYNPVVKYASFLKGKDLLESSIKKDPANVELRFLRYTVQSNAPAFLFYNQNIDEDRKFLNDALTKKIPDKDLLARISEYLKKEKKQ